MTKVLMVDSFQELSWEIGKFGKNAVWVFDSNSALMVRPLPEPNVILENGEKSKNFSSIQRILETASENKLFNDATFISIGGGVVSDITGFASAIWMYGSRLILVPTTLVGMADACIGGRTGIAFRNSPDRVGVYHQAETVIICPDALKSLSKTDIFNGLAVIIKHAYLSDNEEIEKILFTEKQKILAFDPVVMKKLIALSLDAKKKYLEPVRRISLEMGEVLAFTLRFLYPSRFSYGKALAWGMCRSAEIAIETGLCTRQFGMSLVKTCQSLGYDVSFRIPRTQWQETRAVLNRAKSISDRSVKLVLPVSQGKTELVSVDEETLKKIIIENALL